MEYTKENIIALLLTLDERTVELAKEADKRQEYALATQYYVEGIAYIKAARLLVDKEYFDELCKELNLK